MVTALTQHSPNPSCGVIVVDVLGLALEIEATNCTKPRRIVDPFRLIGIYASPFPIVFPLVPRMRGKPILKIGAVVRLPSCQILEWHQSKSLGKQTKWLVAGAGHFEER